MSVRYRYICAYINDSNHKPASTDCETGRNVGEYVLLNPNDGKDNSNSDHHRQLEAVDSELIRGDSQAERLV